MHAHTRKSFYQLPLNEYSGNTPERVVEKSASRCRARPPRSLPGAPASISSPCLYAITSTYFFPSFSSLFLLCLSPYITTPFTEAYKCLCWRQTDMGATNPFSGPGGSHFATRYDFAKLRALHLFLLFLISLPIESTYRGYIFVPPGFCDSWLSFGSRMLALCFRHHATWS